MNNSGTMIGRGILIRGEISGAEDCFLDGTVEGNITLEDNRLTVGPDGLAQADIVTGDLVVFGRVEGSVRVSACAELKRSAFFTGEIVASRLSIEDGASMQGFVDLTQDLRPNQNMALRKKAAAAEPAGETEELESLDPQYSEAV